MERPIKGDVIEFRRGRKTLKGTVIGVAVTKVHYLVEVGIIQYRVGITRVVRILDGADEE